MKRLLLATTAFVAASSAFAVGPMTTQSADILDRGNCDVEGQWGRDNAKLGAAKFHVTHLGLRADCGVIDGTQIGLVGERIKFQNEKADGLSLVGKTRLWDDDKVGGKLALTYGIHGLRQRNLDFDYAASSVGLAYTQTLAEKHKLHANANVTIAKGGDSTKGWALGYEYAVAPTVSLLAETYGEEDSKPTQALGVRWAPAKNWSVGAMVARPRLDNGINGRVTQFNTTVAYRF
jgi:hypothetical protein